MNEPIKSNGYIIKYRGHKIYDIYKKDTHYAVDRDNWTCSCPAWYYSKEKDCKHLQLVKSIRGN